MFFQKCVKNIMKNLNMKGSYSDINPRDPGQWIINPSLTIRFQKVFYQNPNFQESRLKDGRTGLMNSTEHSF
jgi:hypothetical protein